MRPATGERFTWQSNTFMKTEIRVIGSCGRSSSTGGTAVVMRLTRPSAGDTTRPSRSRGHAGRIAEEIAHPDGEDSANPEQRRPQAAEQNRRHQRDQDEDVAFLVDRNHDAADRVENVAHDVVWPFCDEGGWQGRRLPSSGARPAGIPGNDREVANARFRPQIAGASSSLRSSSSVRLRVSRAFSASRWRFHMAA